MQSLTQLGTMILLSARKLALLYHIYNC